jgi:serine/threonine protein kinase
MPSPLLRLGQVVKGKLGKHITTKKTQDTVWFAKSVSAPKQASSSSLLRYRNKAEKLVVIKSVLGRPRVANERDVLKRFQHRTPYLRPMIDEIEESDSPPTIVLRYLDDHLLNASIKSTLNRKELKYVTRRVLEALRVLHEDGYVRTGRGCLWFGGDLLCCFD